MIDLTALATAISTQSSKIRTFCLASAKVSIDHEKRIAALETPTPAPAPEPAPAPLLAVTVAGTPMLGMTLSAVVS